MEPVRVGERHTCVTTRLRTATTTVALLLTLAGCGAGVGPFDQAEPQSSLVVTWSEADHADLKANDAAHPSLRTRLVDTAQAREKVLADLPASIPTTERARVESIDLTSQVIVLGVYGKCTETSHLEMDDAVLTFVVERDDDVNCAWAPTQVEVWSVAREGLSSPIRFHDQRGEPA